MISQSFHSWFYINSKIDYSGFYPKFSIISILISECNWWFSSWRVSWILYRSKRLLLLRNDISGLRLSVWVLLPGFWFFLFLFIVVRSCPWRVLAYRIILEFWSCLLLILARIRNCSNFTSVTPSIIFTISIIMCKTESACSTRFMVNFHWCLTLVMFWKIHLIFIFITKM